MTKAICAIFKAHIVSKMSIRPCVLHACRYKEIQCIAMYHLVYHYIRDDEAAPAA